MKNFIKRFRHAAKRTIIRSKNANLKKRLFMGKHLFIECCEFGLLRNPTYTILPFSVIMPQYKKRHYHRMNLHLIKNAVIGTN